MLMLSTSCGDVAASLEEGQEANGIWGLESYVSADDPLVGAALVLEINIADAVVRGESLCHSIFGSLTLTDEGNASFTIPGATNQPCDDNFQAIENALIRSLESVTTWERQADQLILTGPRGLALEFRQAG